MKAFDRRVDIVVAPTGAGGALGAIQSTLGFNLSNLDCVFRVKKSLKVEPNTCELRVFNLQDSTRRVLEGSKLVLRLEAGYADAMAQLFLGEVRAARTSRDGPDIVTEISTGDSEEEMRKARIKLVVGPKQPVDTALLALAQALGVGRGNAAIAAAKLKAKGKAFFGPGTVLHGNAARVLTDFCKSADLEWSIQDGQIQILDRGKALERTPVLLDSSIIVGSPSIDGKGVLEVKSFLHPDLVPGRLVQVQSLGVRGVYRITDVEYTGDTKGQDWYANMHCKSSTA